MKRLGYFPSFLISKPIRPIKGNQATFYTDMPIIKSIYWDQNDSETLVYQFPFKDVTTGSVLTVNDSQEAYFYKNGSLCDKFEAGRHVLSSSNLPIINKLINIPSGGQSTFKASVWFVSKLEKRNMLWGTGGLRIIDPYFQVPIKLSARGQYGVRIQDGGLFLLKFVGTQSFANMELIYDQFRVDVVEAVRVSVSRFIKETGMNINEIGTEYKAIAKVINAQLQQSFDEYGVELLNLNIEDISFDENDKGYQTVMEGIAEQAKLNKLGVNYIQQKQIDIAQNVASNTGAGVFMGAGMGFGIGNKVGETLSNVMDQSQVKNSFGAMPELPSFYVAKNGQTTGPFPLDIIRSKVVDKEIVETTYVYRVGGTSWVSALQEPEIAKILKLMVPPPPPPAD